MEGGAQDDLTRRNGDVAVDLDARALGAEHAAGVEHDIGTGFDRDRAGGDAGRRGDGSRCCQAVFR
jgi:hypothetical protein